MSSYTCTALSVTNPFEPYDETLIVAHPVTQEITGALLSPSSQTNIRFFRRNSCL